MPKCWLYAWFFAALGCVSLGPPPDPTPQRPWRLCQYEFHGGRELFEHVEVVRKYEDGDYEVVYVDRYVNDDGKRDHGKVTPNSIRQCKGMNNLFDAARSPREGV